MRLVPLSSDSYNEDVLCLMEPTRVTSNYDNPSLPWVTFMPILWNTTEGDQFQKYTKESISWPFVGKWASLMHRTCLTLQCIHIVAAMVLNLVQTSFVLIRQSTLFNYINVIQLGVNIDILPFLLSVSILPTRMKRWIEAAATRKRWIPYIYTAWWVHCRLAVLFHHFDSYFLPYLLYGSFG